jgi:glycine/D-amino acid oxidase-like deaminating enzyme
MLVYEPEAASWSKIAHVYGPSAAKDYYNAQVGACHIIATLIKNGSISCDYRPHHLVMAGDTEIAQKHILEDFVTRKKIGAAAKILNPAKTSIVNRHFTSGERVPHNISVNPLLFARGFAQYLKKKGVVIYEHTPILDLHANKAVTAKATVGFDTLVECRGAQDSKTHVDTFLTTIAITRKLTRSELGRLSMTDRDMFIDDEKRSFHYGKITRDDRLLVGYGDILKKDTAIEDDIHLPHKENIERFLKKTFKGADFKIVSSWSHRYALSKTILPYVSVSKRHLVINGAGTQIATMVCAEYAVSQLFKEKHTLHKMFSSKKSYIK